MMLALRPKIHSLETTHAYALRLANANGLRRIPGTLLERRISSGIAARTDLPGPLCQYDLRHLPLII